MRNAARIWSNCRCPSPQYRRAARSTGLTPPVALEATGTVVGGATTAMTAPVAVVAHDRRCSGRLDRDDRDRRTRRGRCFLRTLCVLSTCPASGKHTCMINLRARRPRPRRARRAAASTAVVERSPDACEHAPVRLLAALHSQDSKQARSQPACTTEPARRAVYGQYGERSESSSDGSRCSGLGTSLARRTARRGRQRLRPREGYPVNRRRAPARRFGSPPGGRRAHLVRSHPHGPASPLLGQLGRKASGLDPSS